MYKSWNHSEKSYYRKPVIGQDVHNTPYSISYSDGNMADVSICHMSTAKGRHSNETINSK